MAVVDPGDDVADVEDDQDPQTAFKCMAFNRVEGLSKEENDAREALACTPIRLIGRVHSTGGAAIAGATAELEGRTATTGADGTFELEGLHRRNAVVTLSEPGHLPLAFAVELRRPVTQAEVDLGMQLLSPKDPAVSRLIFTGDFSMGRRFLDSDESTPRHRLPPDDPTAWIKVSDPAPGSLKVVSFVKPLFPQADFRVVNLESPVTANPATPHQTKDYAFFTLPESLKALKSLDVGFVSLGNNHTYDYLDAGLADTRKHLEAAGLPFAGAGRNENEAFAPYRTKIGEVPVSFVSACSIAGDEHSVNYVASSTKGGAADLRDDDRVRSTIQGEAEAGRVPIALLHSGIEYSETPQQYTLDRMKLVVDSGAAVAIGHHPHTAQGFGWYKGQLQAYSLGNFVFDQDRLETMLGMVADVELRGSKVERASAFPIYIEDYRPRPVAGALADGMLRRIADLSRSHRADVVPTGSRISILGPGQESAYVDRTATVNVTIGPGGVGHVDLRAVRRPLESVAQVSVRGATRIVAGRDILEHGDFEDHDVDEQDGELERWDLPAESSYWCYAKPRRGVAALCQVRDARSLSTSLVAFKNRVRVPGDALNTPNKWLTLITWARGENAGAARAVVRYYASEGDAEFGSEVAVSFSGTSDWLMLANDLRMPTDPSSPTPWNAARALRVFFELDKPSSGGGLFSTDDVAVVAWERSASGSTLQQPTPNARDFVRVYGPPGTHQVEVTFRSHHVP